MANSHLAIYLKVMAIRKSVNRERDVLETKLLSVTKEFYADFITNKVIPAIHAKWPNDETLESKTVFLQHDSATTRFGPECQRFIEGGGIMMGWNISQTHTSVAKFS
jgi:hypothetical protein